MVTMTREEREKAIKEYEKAQKEHEQEQREKGFEPVSPYGETDEQRKARKKREAKGGRDLSVELKEELRFEDKAKPKRELRREIKEELKFKESKGQRVKSSQPQEVKEELPQEVKEELPPEQRGAVSPVGGAATAGAQVAVKAQRTTQTAQDAFFKAAELFTRPLSNIAISFENLITGSEKETKPTVLDDLIEAGSEAATPAAKEAGAAFGLTGKPTKEEQEKAETAFSSFIEKQEKQLRGDSKEVVIPAMGEAALFLTPFPILRGVSGAAKVISQSKFLKETAKKFVQTKPPKDVRPIQVPKDTPQELARAKDDPFIKKLSKNLGGQGLFETRVKAKIVTDDIIQLEAQTAKQQKAIYYSRSQQKIYVVEQPSKKTTPQSFRLKGKLSDDTKLQVAQQKKFGLTQTDKELFETVGKTKPELKAALEKGGIRQVATVREFSLKQVQENPKEFGRYLFGRDPSPTPPVSTIGLAETKSVGLIKESKKPKDVLGAKEFKAYEEKTVKVGGEKFETKRPTSTFVTDVKKFTKFKDPFINEEKQAKQFRKGKPFDIGEYKIKDPEVGAGGGKNILETKTAKGREKISGQIKAETKGEKEILFTDPRFSGGVLVGLKGSQAMSEQPSNRLIGGDEKFGLKDEISLKPDSGQKEIFNISEDVSLSRGLGQDSGAGLKLTDKLDYEIGTRPKTKPDIGLMFSEDFDYRIGEGSKTVPELTTVTPDPVITIIPKPDKPIEPPPAFVPEGYLPSTTDLGAGYTKKGISKGFLGNVPESDIQGMYKGFTIKYGDEPKLKLKKAKVQKPKITLFGSSGQKITFTKKSKSNVLRI